MVRRADDSSRNLNRVAAPTRREFYAVVDAAAQRGGMDRDDGRSRLLRTHDPGTGLGWAAGDTVLLVDVATLV